MIRLAIISANELRHKYLRRYLNSIKDFSVEICLVEKNNTRQYHEVLKSKYFNHNEKKHFLIRTQVEKSFFFHKITKHKELKNLIFLNKRELNTNPKVMKYLKSKKIDLVVCFGCSIIKDPILNFYKKKFINIHLGLSPYYRGSATNFWPGVNNEPQFFGATFMQLDKGVDTAPILHQFRPLMTINDNIHTIGNKIIMEAISMLPNIIKKFKKIKAVKIDKLKEERVYKKKDYNEKALKSLEKNFKSDMIKKYLKNKKKIDKKYPIIISNCI